MNPRITNASAPTALIVDDLKLNRSLLRHTLAHLGYGVTEAPDGEEAIALLDRQSFDLVFLDWGLPGALKGDHVAHHLRTHPDHAATLLIAITNDTSAPMRQRCENAGARAFLAKAFDAQSVRFVIASARLSLARPEPPVAATNNAAPDDIAAGLARHAPYYPGGLAEACRHFQAAFASEHQSLLATLRSFHWERAALHAHNLDTLAAFIGATALRNTARTCEQALRSEDPTLRAAPLARLETLLAALHAALDRSAP